MLINLFVPCFIDQMFPDTAWNTITLLEKAGCEIHYNPKQTCCGQPLFNSGDVKYSSKLAQKFITDFPNNRPIVTPSASCAAYIRNHYANLVDEEHAQRLQNNTFELTDFLVNQLKVLHFDASFPHKVTYHDACSALREYGLKDEPRQLLKNVADLELIEMPQRTECCGFGGTFMVKYAPISTAMTEQKVEHALSTGAEYIVSTEASCLLNIQSYINAQKLNIKTMHIADVLVSQL
ncbi:(Fe-S)-binding protein [Carboxylicivirga mesophila]|uniref:(Fe-S)-binding protein n=1 Tax=Carboxylicivirga mesophila TaxID=1166478 RepID=A0ABS5K833_9BACT|nr:(Fe-S)-binding protein [Carboxylicivirga mesophila]MBS2211164.1 (Fe-S)-binding protein [Carboxylicivirga mesophila]